MKLSANESLVGYTVYLRKPYKGYPQFTAATIISETEGTVYVELDNGVKDFFPDDIFYLDILF